MSWREYQLAIIGYNNKRYHDFEHTRIFLYYYYAANRKENVSLEPIEKFWPLPTDPGYEYIKPETNAEKEARLKKLMNEAIEKTKSWRT